MLFHARRLVLVCAVLTGSYALPQHRYDHKAYDVTSNGNYLIKRCGKGIPGGKAEQLVSLLQEIAADLPSIITEAEDGTKSIHGFKAFFTSDSSIPPVTHYYSNITSSAPVLIAGVQPEPVTFICLEYGDPFTAWVYRVLTKIHGHVAGLSSAKTEAIYLPPLFFQLPRVPRPQQCPVFGAGAYFRGRDAAVILHGDQELGSTQWGTIIHELVDKYLDFHGRQSHFRETYRLEECIRLPAFQQVINAENYSLFASCKFSGIITP
ncbi:MAG: hypothetical protein Q9208_005988 [Pyrenodesmia sp. 3 TL-2023]